MQFQDLRPLHLLSSENYEGQHSMTEQGQVIDLQTILVNRNRGINPVYFNGTYTEFDTEDIQKMDFIELRELRERTQERIKSLKEDHHGLTVQLEKLREQEMKKKIEASLVKKEEPQNN